MTKAGRGPGPASARASLTHPAVLAAILAAAASILLSVSFTLFDPDLFQHLLVGKVIWTTHSVPQRHLWTWPSYGMPEVLPSWLFRALIWPFWSMGGVWGLFVWRWLTTLLAFGLMWGVARRLGARGVTPLVVLALGALVYRQRSMVRPETLVVVLLALELWVLEARRNGGPNRWPWLVAVACLWANAHISYYLGLVVLGVFGVDEWRSKRQGQPGLGIVLLAAIVVSFLNPFGARALWQPFDYFLHGRHEAIFALVGELHPIAWNVNLVNGLPLLFAGWPLLILARALGRRVDRVEVALAAIFTALIFFGQRFLGFYAVVAAGYVARDLSELVGRTGVARWPVATRAAVAGVACLTLGIPEWSAPEWPIAVRMGAMWYPERACDFMVEHGVRGRGFNSFDLAGYQLYRFWPNRERLPFIDIHQTGSRADRDAYAALHHDPALWKALDGRYHFDYVLWPRKLIVGNAGLDALDADSAFALVFVDDVAALYVRREGALAAVAAREGYRHLSAGGARLSAMQSMCETDSAACADLAAELDRAIAGSPQNAQARSLRANIFLMHGDLVSARRQLESALAVNPMTARARDRLRMIDSLAARGAP